MKRRILVLCTGNSCRSQMAHGYLQQMAGANADVYSAGVETHGLNARAVAIMAADGVDISGHTSNLVDEYMHLSFDFVITVCDNAKERCPWFPGGVVQLHQNFEDPSKIVGSEAEVTEAFRKTRDEIKAFCKTFLESNSLISGRNF